MIIKINFAKNNADSLVEKYVIYRSENKDNLYVDENIVQTVTDFAGKDNIEVIDETALYEKTYYYAMITTAKSGFSTVSSVREINVPKYVGDMRRDVMFGDMNNGFIAYEPIEPETELRIRRIFAASGGVAFTNTPTADQMYGVQCYSNGKPITILNGGSSSFSQGNYDYDILLAWTRMRDEVAKPFWSNGFEYKMRLIKYEEFEKFLYPSICMVAAPVSWNNQNPIQSIVPRMMNPNIAPGYSVFNTPLENSSGNVAVWTVNANGTLKRIANPTNTRDASGNNQYFFVIEPMAY